VAESTHDSDREHPSSCDHRGARGRADERGERYFRASRVTTVSVDPTSGQLRGTVQPSDRARAKYETRIWIKADGLAYKCTCPVGDDGRFCKHAVAVALAHLDDIERRSRGTLASLEQRLRAIPHFELVDRLVSAAREQPELRAVLANL
jgi:uncharacterized Zn finger protein